MAAGTPELQAFIERALAAGHGRQAVRQALLDAGWTGAQVDDVLAQWAQVDFPLPVPVPRASLSPREAFQYLVLFLALYLGAWHLGHLQFALVNHLLPDAANWHASLDKGTVRWSLATVLIVLPLFAWLSGRIGQAVARQPIKRLSPVRRWLTYLTLFLAAGVLVGDLTTLVYHLLGGELTLRFVLKVGVVALIAGAVFGYYLHDLRHEEEPAGQASAPARPGRWLLGAAALLALATVVAVLALTPGPGQRRLQQRDAATVSDLQQLQQAIVVWQRQHQALPADLARVAAQPGIALPLAPADGGPGYRYAVLDAHSYQLCAHFHTDTAAPHDPRQRNAGAAFGDWPHPSGEHCFVRRVGKDD